MTRLEEQIVNANMTPVEPKVETATVEARESTVAPAGESACPLFSNLVFLLLDLFSLQ